MPITPFKSITEDNVDIYKLPARREIEGLEARQRLECVIGDLHANAIKLIWFLVREGVITNLTEENFKKLIAIFQKGFVKYSVEEGKYKLKGLTREDIQEFNKLIDALEFNQAIAVKLIGDDICDRVGNDYFVLKILSQLSKKKVPLEILLSNHSIEFIDIYEKSCNEALIVETVEDTVDDQKINVTMRVDGFFPTDNIQIETEQTTSSLALRLALEDELIAKEEVTALYDEYQKNICALSYSLLPDGRLVIYSHAPISLNTIKLMAAKVKVQYLDATALELARTIDRINEKVKALALENKIHELYDFKNLKPGEVVDPVVDPFLYLMWNRDISIIPANSYHFVHGHTTGGNRRGVQRAYKEGAHVTNLDNHFGKLANFSRPKFPGEMRREFIDVPAYFHNGTYTAVVSVNTRVPELAQLAYSDDLVEKGPLPHVLGSGSPEQSAEANSINDAKEERLNEELKSAVKSLIDQVQAFDKHLQSINFRETVLDMRFGTWKDNFINDVRVCFLTETTEENGEIKLQEGDNTHIINSYTFKKAIEIDQNKYEEFKSKVSDKLEIDKYLVSSMNYTTHRKFYKVVLANIAIALTGIGAILLAAHAIHDRVKKGSKTSVNSALFFGHTRREKMRDKMESTFGEIKKRVPKKGRLAG